MIEAHPDLPFASPDRVHRGPTRWIYVVPIALIHAAALLALWPWLFSWSGLVCCLVGVHLFGQGINIGYHRLLTHRSFKVPTWLEHLIVGVALCCLQDTPARWVATHRVHHIHSDEPPDPHTPRVSFFWAHMGWLMVRNPGTENLATYEKYARDILVDPFYMKLEKRRLLPIWLYLGHALFIAGLGAGLGAMLTGTAAGAAELGLSWLVWGVLVRTVLVWHITWSVNSLTHVLGYQSYDTGEDSRNNWLVALLTVGEGWHNNHHHDPASASVQHRWWEVDISYYEIRLLEMLGLAKKVVLPRHIRHAHRNSERETRNAEQ